MPSIAVMALSGGMDSTCLLLRLLREGHEVTALSFDYGQRHRMELERASANVQFLRSRGLPVVQRHVDLRSAMATLDSALTDHEARSEEHTS